MMKDSRAAKCLIVKITSEVQTFLSLGRDTKPRRSLLQRCSILGTLTSLCCLVGCVSTNDIKTYLIYEPVQVESPMSVSISAEVTHSTAPEVIAAWKVWAWNIDSINGEELVANAIYEDLAKSKMFSSVSRDNPNADLLIVVHSREIKPSDFRLQLNLAVLNPKTKETVLIYDREQVYATGATDYRLKETLRDVLGQIKTALVADFKNKDLSKLGGVFAMGTTATVLPTGDQISESGEFEDLLVAKEANVMLARQRNRTLIAAKTLTLPSLLRDRRTPELTALTIQIEQLILDLNHEAEMEKDRAQRAAEQDPEAVEYHRELAIVYKERIEVLKPINAAIKEEIANRNR
jgi:hypothetical protein